MNWWQTSLAAIAVGVLIWFAATSVQRSRDEAEWASAKIHYDSLITELMKPLPAVRETTFVEHTKWRDNPETVAWAESSVAAAKGDAARLQLLVYNLSVDRYADTSFIQTDSTEIGLIAYRSDIHQEYIPRRTQFIFDLHNSFIQFPELKETGTKTIVSQVYWWEKPMAVIGGAVCGYGVAKGDGALAAIGGAVAIISIAIDF